MGQSMAEYLIKQGQAQGEARGEARGETRAKQAAVVKLLQLRFNEVPEHVANRITLIQDFSRLDGLFEDALNAESLSELNLESRDR